MNQMEKLYYRLTAHIPRLLPRNETEYRNLCKIMLKAYNLADEPATWITIAGHITSVPSHKVRRSYGSMANAAKRLKINQLAYQQKTLAVSALEVKLQEEAKKLILIDGTKDIETKPNEFPDNQFAKL